MSLRAAVALRSRLLARASVQRRSAQTVPRLGTEEEMKAEAIEQIRARIARQKEIMSGGHTHAEEVNEMWKWVKISIIVGFPVCVLTVIKDQFLEHPHRLDGPEPSYMNIRTKEFPWECSDCALFDLDCWKKCKAEKAAEAAGGH